MKEKPHIIASVRFYAKAEGGRARWTLPEVFRCPLEYEGEKFDCALLLEKPGSLAPEQSVIVPIVFLHPELIKHRLRVGNRFTLWELGTIADGIVKEIPAD